MKARCDEKHHKLNRVSVRNISFRILKNLLVTKGMHRANRRGTVPTYFRFRAEFHHSKILLVFVNYGS